MPENNPGEPVTREELNQAIRDAVFAVRKGKARRAIGRELHSARDDAVRAETRDLVNDKTRDLVKKSDFVRLEAKFKFACWILAIVAAAFGPALAAEVLQFWLGHFQNK